MTAGETPPDAEQIADSIIDELRAASPDADLPLAYAARVMERYRAALREAGYLTKPNAAPDLAVVDRIARALCDQNERAENLDNHERMWWALSTDEVAQICADALGGLAVGSDVPTGDALIEAARNLLELYLPTLNGSVRSAHWTALRRDRAFTALRAAVAASAPKET